MMLQPLRRAKAFWPAASHLVASTTSPALHFAPAPHRATSASLNRALFISASRSLASGAGLGATMAVGAVAYSGSPIGLALRTSALVIAAINTAGFAITALTQSHKITDLTGTSAFIASAWVTHYLSCRAKSVPLLAPTKSLLLTSAVTLWGVRLAGFLFLRVLKTGKDKRLEQFFPRDKEEKLLTGRSKYPLKLLGFWTAQALWAFVVLLPVTVASTANPTAPLGLLGKVALGGFAVGFLWESVADTQKFVFKNKHPDRFIGEGLYKYSRHANYFGEIVVWVSVCALASNSRVLYYNPWILLSPAAIITLLLFVSGVPPLEASHEKRFGKDPAYLAYKASTPLIVPYPKSLFVKGAEGDKTKEL